MNPIFVDVLGGSSLTQAAFCALLRNLPGLDLARPGDGHVPDVILWLADSGVQGLAELRRSRPSLPVVVVAEGLTPRKARSFLEMGCLGCLSRDDEPATLNQALRHAARGEGFMPQDLALALLQEMKDDPDGTVAVQARLGRLSPRELEVLTLLGHGLSNKDIAARLYLSVRTVEGHLLSLYRKLEVHNRVEAAVAALRLGLGGETGSPT